ncbi:MAG: mannitol-1-phosphate 5-dehydrogenase [Cyclobacteriaceae bacterium]|nr:mannitol-1-phosphate 5-dehydrogenase [Cyclobacteriaceae bacterium]
MESEKLVLFGAGKVGRSFIAQLFSRSGFQVVLVDVDETIIAALNVHRKYQVIIKSDDGDESIWIENVRGVLATDVDRVVQEIASADMLATAVGQQVLPKIAPTIAKGLALRFEKTPDHPLDIILAENLRDAAGVFKKELQQHLPEIMPPGWDFSQFVGLVETSIGKMVPIMPVSMTDKDPLLVYAEAYNTLILDKKAFRNPVPNVIGLLPKDNMAAWVDRKSFIHNLGHAAAVYCGFAAYPKLTYLHELMAQPDIYETTRATMVEAANVLMKHHEGEFTYEEIVAHIDDLLFRFSNKALGDTVYRVGQDLFRKLGPEDRLVGVLKLAIEYRLPFHNILFAIVCAMEFMAVDEHGQRTKSDVQFTIEARRGISHILETVCDLSVKDYFEIHDKARGLYARDLK